MTLSGGVAFAQVLPFLFYPLLGRIFTAEEFGLLASLSTIISILAVLGSGKYENGILVVKDKLEAANIALLCILLGLIVMLVSWVVMQFLMADALSKWLHEPNINQWIFVCPLAAFFIIVYNVYNEWCVREERFKGLSVNKIVNSGAIVLSKTFFGLCKIVSHGLVVGDLVGRAISAMGCVGRALWMDGGTFAKTNIKSAYNCFVRYREYPMFTMPGQLLNTIGQSIPIWVIGYYFTKENVGLFSMAQLIFAVPITIISTSLRDVYRQRANEEFHSKGNCKGSFDKMLSLLTTISVVALAIFVWFLPWLTQLILGDQWYVSGQYAQILAPMMVMSFIADPLSGVFIVSNKLRAFFWWQVIYILSTFVGVMLGACVFKSMMATLVCYAIFRSIAYLLSIVMTRKYAKG